MTKTALAIGCVIMGAGGWLHREGGLPQAAVPAAEEEEGGITMNKPRERSPYAGCEVKTRDGQVFLVEDWWENVYGRSWMVANGNPAAMVYGIRIGMKGTVPIDNEVLYGKINGRGCLVHVSELCLEES